MSSDAGTVTVRNMQTGEEHVSPLDALAENDTAKGAKAIMKEQEVRLTLPGKGALEASTLAFLAECGMKVNRSNPRQYLARIASMPGVEVVFQRAADIPTLVSNGDATLGITGYDILAEHRGYSDDEDGDGDSDDEISSFWSAIWAMVVVVSWLQCQKPGLMSAPALTCGIWQAIIRHKKDEACVLLRSIQL